MKVIFALLQSCLYETNFSNMLSLNMKINVDVG